MRTVGMMLVDLAQSRVGLPSRASEELAGEPVLRRSVGRALAARRLDQVALLARPAEHEQIRSLLADLAPGSPGRVGVYPLPAEDAAYGAVDPGRVRLARRWALSCWRGGIGGACWFDELAAPAAMAALAGQLNAEAVALLSPEAALADAALIDAIVEQHEKNRDRFRMAFSQAPPGLGTICLTGDMLADLARTGQTIGRLLAYDPGEPRRDYVASDAALKIPIDVMACPHRFLADTARGKFLLERLIDRLGDSPSAEQVARSARFLSDAETEFFPREIDLELSTERRVTDSLRPGGPLVPARGPAGPELIERLCESIRACGADDLLVTLGGHGDALCHPRLGEVASALAQAGALAVAVRTSGVGLDEAMVAGLLDSAVDVLVVELDAASADAYRRLKGVDGYDQVVAGMQRLLARRGERNQPGPLLVAEIVKCPGTLDELEAFFDRWRFCDEAHVAGLHDYAGQFESSAGPGWPSAPPGRRPCVRINRRLTVLADGDVVACEQDFCGRYPSGRLSRRAGIDEVWRGREMQRLRADQRDMKLAGRPLCRACDQWHRP